MNPTNPMSSNEKFWLYIWFIVTTGVCTLALGGCSIQRRHERAMVAMGYQETPVHSVTAYTYQKAK